MGTRSLTHIHDGDLTDEILTTIYRQMDGYPKGHGLELAEILAPLTIVNGFGRSKTPQANGMGCLAAQLIKALKDGVGSIYVYKPNASGCGEDYIYHIYARTEEGQDYPTGEPWLEVSENGSFGVPLFNGPVTQYKAWLTEYEKKKNA